MKNIFSFIDKITRTEFWLTILGYALIVAGHCCLVIFGIVDAGYPWYLVFLDFFPVFGPIAVIILECLPSSEIQLSKKS